MYICASIVCTPVYLSIHLSIYLSIYPSINLSIYQSNLSIYQSIYQSIYLYVHILYVKLTAIFHTPNISIASPIPQQPWAPVPCDWLSHDRPTNRASPKLVAQRTQPKAWKCRLFLAKIWLFSWGFMGVSWWFYGISMV